MVLCILQDVYAVHTRGKVHGIAYMLYSYAYGKTHRYADR